MLSLLDHRASETEFLRLEVAQLERVIGAARTSQTDELTRLSDECAHLNDELVAERAHASACDVALAEARAELEAVRSDRGLTTEEVIAWALHAQVLREELSQAEAECAAAAEAEGCALSVARSYRGFAAHGASQLDTMHASLDEMGGRIEARLASLHDAAHAAVRGRALRAAIASSDAQRMVPALRRWARLVADERTRTMWAARLERAVKGETEQLRADRTRTETMLRTERADAVSARRAAGVSIERLTAERDAAVEAAATSGTRAERAEALLAEQGTALRDALARAETAESALRTAEEGRERANAALAEVSEARRDLSRELEACRIAHADERQQRAFLSRALADERRFAGRREAAETSLGHVAREHAELRAELGALGAQAAAARAEVSDALLRSLTA